MRYVILLISLIAEIEGFAQGEKSTGENKLMVIPATTSYIDSIKFVLSTAKADKLAKLQFELFREYLPISIDSSEYHLDRSLISALESGDSLDIANANHGRGILMKGKGRLDLALVYYKKALEISRRNDFQIKVKFLLNGIALIYMDQSNYEEALQYNLESLKLREQLGDPKDISVTLNNIGAVYFEMGNYEEALRYYEDCYDLKRKNNLSYDLALALVNIADVYNNLGEFSEAESEIKNALIVCDSTECGPYIYIEAFRVLGESQLNQGNLEMAEFHLEKSLNLSLKYEISKNSQYYISRKSESYYWLARLKFEKRKHSEVLQYLALSQAIAKKGGFQKQKARNYQLYARTFYRLGDFKRSADSLFKFQETNSQILNAEVIRKVAVAQFNFDNRLREAKMKDQEAILGLQKETIQQQRTLNLLTGAVAMLILGIAFILIRMVIRKQKTNEILDLRVRERTHDLEMSRDEFRHANEEKIFVLKKVSGDLTEALASLNGISSLAAKDQFHEQAAYFDQVGVVTKKMMSYINQYIPKDSSKL